MRAKMALVAAAERGESAALGTILAEYPTQVAELAEFRAALLATSSYEHEAPTPEVDALAERALARAFDLVFPARVAVPSVPVAVAAASLQALRKARNLAPRALANKLGLGVDVLTNLERGFIRAATVPERLVRALGDALDTSAEQIHTILRAQAMTVPAMLRSTEGQSIEAEPHPELDFERAVVLSPMMTAEQKAAWLER
jgi:transcriptional regulator with XRE-family HTH domain